MIKVEYLVDRNGGDRYGTCSGCSKGSKDDPKMIAVTLKSRYSGIVICLCDECRRELYKKI